MARWTPGLRGKSLLALAIACAAALLAAVLLAEGLAAGARAQFGAAYARNFTLLHRERILAPISRELALSQRLADSVLLKRMLRDPADAPVRAAFFDEAEGYRHAFRGRSWFAISALDLNYWFNEEGKPRSQQPRYRLSREDPEDGWFFATLAGGEPYNINVNYDAKLEQTRIWLNVLVEDAGEAIGLAGSGLDFSTFLTDFTGRHEPGVVPIIVAADGAIQAHPDPERVALNSAEKEARPSQTLAGLLPGTEAAGIAAILAESRSQPDEAILREVRVGDDERLLAVTYIPELRWHVAALVDLGSAELSGGKWLLYLGLGLALVLLVLLAGFGYLTERLVLRPLRALQRSADAISRGEYAVHLPPAGNDEIGALTTAFARMAGQVSSHTAELEDKVRERTAALEASHAATLHAHRQLDASIDYASLIQRAILPDRDLERVLGERHFVLWRPRDVVGGDFYVFRADDDGFLIGLFDCAGHGVPGALMTMLARSAIDHALAKVGAADPAGVLREADVALRALLANARLERALATSTDAGLVHVDRRRGELVFAGAAIGLFHTEGGEVAHVAGSRRGLADRRVAEYRNVRLPLRPGTTWCLVTDGLLDQSGGEHGFGFGRGRFSEHLRASAQLPLAAQAGRLAATLAEWQAGWPQRDDITVLSFRID
ncbi:MAG: biofilm regulation protein phosphatase SiaA [Xanthomonadales bacterium]|nr:biofilm regulation protein phosphatase SiaA [Xanthomonadales bacterium]